MEETRARAPRRARRAPAAPTRAASRAAPRGQPRELGKLDGRLGGARPPQHATALAALERHGARARERVPGARADSSTSARAVAATCDAFRGERPTPWSRPRARRGVGCCRGRSAYRRVHRAVVVGLSATQPRRVLHQELDLLGRHVLRRRHHADHRVVLAVLGEQRELPPAARARRRAASPRRKRSRRRRLGRRRERRRLAPGGGAAAPDLVDARRHHARRPRRRLQPGAPGQADGASWYAWAVAAAPRGQRSSSSSVARSCEQVVEQVYDDLDAARGAVRVPAARVDLPERRRRNRSRAARPRCDRRPPGIFVLDRGCPRRDLFHLARSAAASELTVVIKPGWPAVTRKDKFETLNQRVLATTSQQLRATRGSAVLVHGCGSFGHFQAHEFGIAKGTEHPASAGSALPRRANRRRDYALVLGALIDAGCPPSTARRFRSGASAPARQRASAAGVAQCRAPLRAGLLPVLHGDSVLDDARGCAILSGDELLEELRARCDPNSPSSSPTLLAFDKPPSQNAAGHPGDSRPAQRRAGDSVRRRADDLQPRARRAAASRRSCRAPRDRRPRHARRHRAGGHAARGRGVAGRWPECGTRVLRIRGGAIAPPAALPTALQRRWRAAFGCEFCGDTRAVVCPNCDGVGGYTAMGGVDVACKACRGTGRVVCRDCFTGDGYDIEGIREGWRAGLKSRRKFKSIRHSESRYRSSPLYPSRYRAFAFSLAAFASSARLASSGLRQCSSATPTSSRAFSASASFVAITLWHSALHNFLLAVQAVELDPLVEWADRVGERPPERRLVLGGVGRVVDQREQQDFLVRRTQKAKSSTIRRESAVRQSASRSRPRARGVACLVPAAVDVAVAVLVAGGGQRGR